jgi:multidrug efflux system membrane fusion protein
MDVSQRKNIIIYVVTVFCILFLSIISYQYVASSSKKKASGPAALQVSVMQPKQLDVPIYLHALGTITPAATVQIKSQVHGKILKIPYQDGSYVHEGDIIAFIDDEPYKAQVELYQGQLERDEALLSTAQQDLKRYQKLITQSAIAQQQLDTQLQLVLQLQGSVNADKGALKAAQINLNNCVIRAPVEGFLGLKAVDTGNIITANNNTIFILNTIDPMMTVFSLPEDKLSVMQEQSIHKPNFSIQLLDKYKKNMIAETKIFFLNNQIDVSTGTFKVKAQFVNNEKKLFAHQFVHVRILIDIHKNALIIPTAALSFGKKEHSVYCLQEDGTTIKKIKVKIGEFIDNNVVIEEGITLNDKVITTSTEQLRDGLKVRVKAALS